MSPTEAIDFVLWCSGEPMTAQEIYLALPMELMDRALDSREFWQYFGMYLRNHEVDYVMRGRVRAYFLPN